MSPSTACDTSAAPPGQTSVCVLSNGRYNVMLSAAGSGFSRWRDLAVTRWREDSTVDGWGSYVFLRDGHAGTVSSITAQPCGHAMDGQTFHRGDGRAEFIRCDGALSRILEVAVAADCDAELRRVTLHNHTDHAREIELTSYTELVLGPAAADAGHPAFSKLFVQTEWLAAEQVVLATRRRRTASEVDVWVAHFAVADPAQALGEVSCETDRARFIGRGRTLRHALAMQRPGALSNTAGTVLDPVFSLRQRVSVASGERVQVMFWTVLAPTREALLAQVERLRVEGAAERVFQDAARDAAARLSVLGMDVAQCETFDRQLGPLLYAQAAARAPQKQLALGRGGPPVLWSAGISGDRPIALLQIEHADKLDHARDLLLAQRYWRALGIGADVVLLNNAAASDSDALQDALDHLVCEQQAQLKKDADGIAVAAFALRESALDDSVRNGLFTVARLVLGDGQPGDDEPPDAPAAVAPSASIGVDTRAAAPRPNSCATASTQPETLVFDNGTGGFAVAAREYVITLRDGECTPAPWVNVIANPEFGCMVSADGGGYCWSLNSQQNPLTPWPNDPVSDAPHEVLYLRDRDSGELWSAAALPIRVAGATYMTRHGKGYSRLLANAHGIDSELLQFVPVHGSIKLSRLILRNRSGRTRRLSLTAYVEWALGANGSTPAPTIITAIDAATGALFVRNPWRADFDGRVAFIDLAGQQQARSGDRRAFLGHLGSLAAPAALRDGAPLDGRTGAGLDPCGALQMPIELAVDGEIEVLFLLGDASDENAAHELIETYRAADLDAVLDQVHAQWSELLDTVQVRTPDPSMDLLLNDWLLYQTLSCRLWARTAYYQASGAFGFRDQLQDVMALCVARPDLAREHILRAAGRQFVEGDVQHWWLPPVGQGIRTRISDDRIWLTYVAAYFLEVTGDLAALDESVPFLTGPALKEGEVDAFFVPTVAGEPGSLYEHCARAIDSSITLGAHGLPLIRTGDWNDGMNRVGEQGRGESTWLAWFLIAAIEAFAPRADARGDAGRAQSWRRYAEGLRAALEQSWDGEWYRRGYYDDGTSLGSRDSMECRIDVIAQSWSLMCDGARSDDASEHASQAMAAVDRQLIRHDDQVALLFTPPFDHTPKEPGYIKGYPPGIRENGGQYTHGAIWSVYAYARLGQGQQASDLFAILNPIRHSSTAEQVARYKVEPYVSCADVYSTAPHIGRGGWTWYSGSAGWLYRAGLEAILGFRKHGDMLAIDPCIPATWPRFDITYCHRGIGGMITRYHIAVENPSGLQRGAVLVEVDGARLANKTLIPLLNDGQVHRVRVVLIPQDQ